MRVPHNVDDGITGNTLIQWGKSTHYALNDYENFSFPPPLARAETSNQCSTIQFVLLPIISAFTLPILIHPRTIVMHTGDNFDIQNFNQLHT